MHALETAHPEPGTAPPMRRFEALYRDEFAFVWSVARHLGVAPAVIEDVVQDVFLTAYRRLDHLRYEVSPRAWLFGVTRRVAFRYRRGAARRAHHTAALAELPRLPAETPQQRQDDARLLERLLAGLGSTGRTVWEMTELLGMSAPEIASELGVPLNTVYSRLRLARAQLQGLVAVEGITSLRDGARREQEPPGAAKQRCWALLLPTLGHKGAGAGLLAWLKGQSAMATTLLATGVVAVGVVAARPAPSPAPAGPPTTVRHAATTRPAATPPASASFVSAPSVPSTEPIVEQSAPIGAQRRAPVRPVSPPVDPQARLREEIRLIDQAHRQFAANDAAAAMATLATHAQQFPGGVFADIREAAHIDALCRGGDPRGAAALAVRLRAEHPGSAVAQRFVNYRCIP